MDAARVRRRQTYRPATLNNHRSTHILFIQFCRVFGVPLDSPSVDHLSAFAEWLILSGLAAGTVRNHLSSVKTFYVWWNKPGIVSLFRSDSWALTIRAVNNTLRPSPHTKAAV